MGKLRALVVCSRLGLDPGVSKFLSQESCTLALHGTAVWEPVNQSGKMRQTRQKSTHLNQLPQHLSFEKWQQP